MEYRCDVEGCDFTATSPAALGSHKHFIHGIKAETSYRDSQIDRLEDAIARVEALANLPSRDSGTTLLTCPDCGGVLTLMRDSPGIYKFRCMNCWSEY